MELGGSMSDVNGAKPNQRSDAHCLKINQNVSILMFIMPKIILNWFSKHSVLDKSEIFHSRVIFWMNQIIATLLVFEECILVRFHFNFISSPFLLIGVDVYYAKLVCQNGQKERDILSHGFWLFSLVSAKFENSINLCVQ